jgi:hypothetical protein
VVHNHPPQTRKVTRGPPKSFAGRRPRYQPYHLALNLAPRKKPAAGLVVPSSSRMRNQFALARLTGKG